MSLKSFYKRKTAPTLMQLYQLDMERHAARLMAAEEARLFDWESEDKRAAQLQARRDWYRALIEQRIARNERIDWDDVARNLNELYPQPTDVELMVKALADIKASGERARKLWMASVMYGGRRL